MDWISIIKDKLKIYPKMSLEEITEFQNEIKSHIKLLESSTEYPKDFALKRVVEILKEVNTKSDLKRQKELINRIALDGVENWETIKEIGEFLKTH